MMTKKQIKFSLIYRDMWQSSGKYVPRVDQLKKIAPVIIDMGCFSRIETNGGAFEQVNLLYGENPNNAVREWTKPFNEAGIQTHMLERALNGIRMFPVPADVRHLMFRVKKAQGTNIARSFCGLNDPRNLELSIKYAKEAGMISQAALSITHSAIHTVDYYMGIVDKAIEFGADEICLKDMAGIGRPATLGKLVKSIKQRYPETVVQYHGHSGPGFSVASMLEVARAGADYVDVAMEPLSWGMVHPDVITIQSMLKDDGFDVPEINMKAYMEARHPTQRFIDDFLGYFIDPKNRYLSSLLVKSGLPGGMMGSLMADLKGVHQGINMSLKAAGKPELNEDELLVKLFDEVAYVWPKLGYPPLVTPFSQYVKNVALLNIVQLAKGEARYSMMDENTWAMILGRAGKLPGELAPEIVEMAKQQKREFYTGNPQDLYPDVLDKYRSEMIEKGWDLGENEEELFEFAMHETQYRDFKSGLAKKRFEEEVEKARSKTSTKTTIAVNEKPSINRNSYSKEKVDYPVAMIAYLLYSFSEKPTDTDQNAIRQNNVWSAIGYWRNQKTIHLLYDNQTIPVIVNKNFRGDYYFGFNGFETTAKLLHLGNAEVDFRIDDQSYTATISAGQEGMARVVINNSEFQMMRTDLLEQRLKAVSDEDTLAAGENKIFSPLPGRVFKINVKEGDAVSKGDILLVIDAMKMENNILAKKDATVKKILVALHDMVDSSAVLIELE